MKKISILIAIICLSAGILTSCKSDKNKKKEETTEHHKDEKGRHLHGENKEHPEHGDRKGPPPHGEKGQHGERKGPPRGGLPEETRTLEEIGGYLIGDTAEDFLLKNVDGSMVSLASIKNAKGYIVTFTCNECPFSKLYEDRLIALNNTYATKGYPVVAINSNNPSNEKEGYEAMQTRAKEKGFTFPYLVDEGQKLYPKYGAVRTPHIFLLDKDLTVQYIGTIDDNAKSPENVKTKYVEDAIAALEKGEKPNPSTTKAIGCPIK
ncbi:thioredoxin family protein [Oceanihabitans sp. 2_MG-2023]|uniref:thioredoxin family protein n=1 Tax=Oceanihabitans sp. 2_MG-2023 TaxID=3062661 RepID=UPI0026E446B4|nr:thioredoxin family protein [Oceanihabitans sp. 2_MG-2023]MDO6595586.1 thioredoxin family protein [Oceanihabitans sp. 2_MG-2023]